MSQNAPDHDLAGYAALQRERPDLFRNAESGGIDILTDPPAIELAKKAATDIRRQRGQSVSDIRVGILAHDPYMTIMRDAVRFPDGSFGLYTRIIEERSVAILPIIGDCLVLLYLYRHGLRDWSLEFPRGGCDPGEDAEAAARRELLEEIGATAHELISLGEFTPGGSSLSTVARFFAARIEATGALSKADGVGAIVIASAAEVESMIRDSNMIDGFTLSLFLRATCRPHLSMEPTRHAK